MFLCLFKSPQNLENTGRYKENTQSCHLSEFFSEVELIQMLVWWNLFLSSEGTLVINRTCDSYRCATKIEIIREYLEKEERRKFSLLRQMCRFVCKKKWTPRYFLLVRQYWLLWILTASWEVNILSRLLVLAFGGGGEKRF